MTVSKRQVSYEDYFGQGQRQGRGRGNYYRRNPITPLSVVALVSAAPLRYTLLRNDGFRYTGYTGRPSTDAMSTVTSRWPRHGRRAVPYFEEQNFVAESADKTPSKGADLEEDSDVVELTDEVGLATAAPAGQIPEPETLDSMGLKMPEFKMPGEDDGESSAPLEEADTREMALDEYDEAMPQEESAAQASPPAQSNEAMSPSSDKEEGEEEPGYDRQAMVKTIQMDAIDRDALEKDDSSPQDKAWELLDGPRFSPQIIVHPPRVLVKKWREGLPGDVEVIVGGERSVEKPPKPLPEEPDASKQKEVSDAEEPDAEALVAEQVEDAAPIEEDSAEGELETPEPETLPELPQERKKEQVAPPSEESAAAEEPIELDDDLVELDEDDVEEATKKNTPPPPHEKKSDAPRASAKAPAGDGAAGNQASEKTKPKREKSADDDEMKGLVEELMEEEKQQRQKRRGKLRPRDIWFKEVFNEEYLRTVPANIGQITRDECDFIEASLRLKKKSRILDLACGYGRHSLELSRRDYEMVGLDLSKPLLRHAVEGAKKNSLDIKFIHGDMRKLGFSAMFDGCFIWDTSLGYFDDRTNLAVLQGVHRALKVGGRLLVDVINRDYAVGDTPTRLWWEGNGCIFLEESEFDYQRSTLEVERSYIYEDGTPPLEHKSFIRLYSVHELRQMLHVAGFKVLEVSGAQHYRGHFLGASSERIIVLAEKRKRRKPSAPGKKPKSK